MSDNKPKEKKASSASTKARRRYRGRRAEPFGSNLIHTPFNIWKTQHSCFAASASPGCGWSLRGKPPACLPARLPAFSRPCFFSPASGRSAAGPSGFAPRLTPAAGAAPAPPPSRPRGAAHAQACSLTGGAGRGGAAVLASARLGSTRLGSHHAASGRVPPRAVPPAPAPRLR